MPDPAHILIIQPSWVGDAVMATPTLRAIRDRFPAARISYLLKKNLEPVYTGMPWADELIPYEPKASFFKLATQLRRKKFDLAVLLTNSFRTALLCKLARIPRIVGYQREGRGILLTDKLQPAKDRRGRFVIAPIIHYYLALARYLGASDTSLTMELFVADREQSEALKVLEQAGVARPPPRPSPGVPGEGVLVPLPLREGLGEGYEAVQKSDSPTSDSISDSLLARASYPSPQPSPSSGKGARGPLVVLNPGAQYGAAKCWLPEYFAAVNDRLQDELGATVLVSSAPRERQIVDEIAAHSKRPFIDLAKFKPSLGAIKEIIRRCDLMITNDTGPRHIAAAFGVPVVTVFGPTHPDWTQIYFALERQVSVKVHCGPCQLKLCPLDHRCMTRVTPGMVFDAGVELLKRTPLPVLQAT